MISRGIKQLIFSSRYHCKLSSRLNRPPERKLWSSKQLFRRAFHSSKESLGNVLCMADDPNSRVAVVAVCQMTSTNDVDRNLGICKELIKKAKLRGAKAVFLPECFDYVGETPEQSLTLSESLDGPRMQSMCQLAKELDVWLSLGGFHEKGPAGDKRIYNTHVLVDSSGSIVAVYRKTHLFDVDVKEGPKLMESDYCIPGNKIVPPITTPVGNIGLGICYDVRFPELSLVLTRQGAHILTFPSAFTHVTGSAHWEVLLRCRAIENQCYVLAAAQSGQHNTKRRSYGHAMIVDPWGSVIAQCREGTDVCVAEIDLGYLEKIRQQMPLASQKRNDLYGSLRTNEEEGKR